MHQNTVALGFRDIRRLVMFIVSGKRIFLILEQGLTVNILLFANLIISAKHIKINQFDEYFQVAPYLPGQLYEFRMYKRWAFGLPIHDDSL